MPTALGCKASVPNTKALSHQPKPAALDLQVTALLQIWGWFIRVPLKSLINGTSRGSLPFQNEW